MMTFSPAERDRIFATALQQAAQARCDQAAQAIRVLTQKAV